MAKEIQEQKHEDVVKTLHEKEEALRAFRFNFAGSKSRNVREGRNLRRDIARAKTEITRRSKTA